MNAGNIIGIAAFVIGSMFAYFFTLFVPAVPAMADFLYLMSLACFSFGLIGVFHSTTLEGNVWMRRRFANQNIGIAYFLEAGKFAKSFQVNLSIDSVNFEGQTYRIVKNRIFYRKNIPYILFSAGVLENIDMTEIKPTIDNIMVTRFIKQLSILGEALKMNLVQSQLFWITAIGLGIIIVGMLLLYFGAIQPTQHNVETLIKYVSQIPTATPIPSPKGIPGV
jgi:hypothetical protein